MARQLLHQVAQKSMRMSLFLSFEKLMEFRGVLTASNRFVQKLSGTMLPFFRGLFYAEVYP
ncbi:hypothetical protein [uncultured Chryseobacterium sp.]|uniref:hypothetical protein n=1 Tax=uncultured Chryseobacterium sp. TaxID=259322 RepID=UPI0037497CA6